MREFDLIRRFFTPEIVAADVKLGVGDDGAVLQPTPGHDLVAVVDTLVGGVHFPAALDAEDIGYRAVAVNLSDIAAMGATPRWMTLALTLVDCDADWLGRLSRGLSAAAAEHDVTLVGGDTTRGDQLVVTVQLLGDLEPDRVLRRSGAMPGDVIYVSGTIGDAGAGLQILESGETDSPEAQTLVDRFRRPAARVRLGRAIAGTASAAIDVSDGLCADLSRLLQASQVAGGIDVERLPLSDGLNAEFSLDEAHQFALTGGDDYELVFTAPADVDMGVIARGSGTAIAAIGDVRDGEGLVCRQGGEAIDVAYPGYDHFAGCADD